MRFSTRSSAFLPGTGWSAIGDVAAADGGGVADCIAGDCEDCAQAAAGNDSSAATATGAKRLDRFNFIGVFPLAEIFDQ